MCEGECRCSTLRHPLRYPPIPVLLTASGYHVNDRILVEPTAMRWDVELYTSVAKSIKINAANAHSLALVTHFDFDS